MSEHNVTVPDLGGASDVEVIELCVAVGQSISEGQSLIVVESDKASMEIPSPQGGVVTSIEVIEGSSVAAGDLILKLEPDSAGDSRSPATGAAAEGVEASESQPSPPPEFQGTESQGTEPQVTSQVTQPQAAESTSVADQAEPAEQTVFVPGLGGAEQVEIIEIAVAPGDTVEEGDALVVVESDKASMEIPAPVAGEVTEIIIELNSAVAEGDALLKLLSSVSPQFQPESQSQSQPPPQPSEDLQPAAHSDGGDSMPAVGLPASDAPPVTSPAANHAVVPQDSVEAKTGSTVYAGPAVRKLARELSISLESVKGSGPRSRISKDDLHNYVKQLVEQRSTAGAGSAIPAVPDIDFSAFGEVDIQPRSRLHKVTAANMHRSWLNVPHVTQYDDADITELESFRSSLKPQMEQRSLKVSPLPFIVKAVAAALKQNPVFNASLSGDGQSMIVKKYIHIGMAVDTPAGLVVPVIRDADTKGIWQLSAEILELADRAKARKLKPEDMQGGCFTVSSLGNIGGTGFTPIINTPEVGILGVSKLAVKPQFVDGNIEPRKMLPLSLSYDHRAVNGGDAGRFLTFLVQQLQDVRQLLL